MAAKRNLRLATEKDAPDKPLTLAEAVERGSYLDILRAQRRQMVADLKDASGPALAALHRQIGLHSKEIAALDAAADQEAAEGVDIDDEAFNAEAL